MKAANRGNLAKWLRQTMGYFHNAFIRRLNIENMRTDNSMMLFGTCNLEIWGIKVKQGGYGRQGSQRFSKMFILDSLVL